MVKVFNRSMRTFRLETKDGRFLKIPYKAAVDVPEEFTEDITFRVAIAGRELEVYQVAKEVDTIQKEDEKVEFAQKPVEAETVPDVNFTDEAPKARRKKATAE